MIGCRLKLILILLFLILIEGRALSQKKYNLNTKNACSFGCGQIESTIYGYPSSKQADSLVHNILTKVGLKTNFLLISAYVDNALATFYYDGTKVIYYNENFIKSINLNTKNNWPALFILAHEISHHLNANRLDTLEGRPQDELSADEFAGFVLYKLGANLTQTLLALNNTTMPAGCKTHPARNVRIHAATVGWTKGEEEDKTLRTISQRVKDLEIRAAALKPSSSSIDLTLKFVAISEKYGTCFALKAKGSDGMADYWKFSPQVDGKLVDNLGNEYPIKAISGMGYAREVNDYTVLKKGEESVVNISFGRNNWNTALGDKFDLYLEIWVVYPDENSKSARMPYSLALKGIKLQK